MNHLIPAVATALDNLGSLNGNPNIQKFKGPVILWHCGVISLENTFKDNEGIWTFQNENKKEKYSGQAVKWYHDSRLPISRKQNIMPSPTPYLTKLILADRSYVAIDFRGGSLGALTGKYYRGQHDQAKIAMREWAVKKGYDLVIGTNGDTEEIFIVNPQDCLKIIAQKNLLNGSVRVLSQNLIARLIRFLSTKMRC